MNIYESFRILEVKTSASIEEINKSFKMLAKKYHPDANPEKTEWAHQKMSALNQAYQIIIDYKKNGNVPAGKTGPTITEYIKNLFKQEGFDYNAFKARQKKEENFESDKSAFNSQTEQKEEHEYYKTHSSYEDVKRAAEQRQVILQKTSHNFKVYKDVIDEGMFVYYQYKLYKLPMRNEGVGRLKFGDVKRLLKKGLMALEKLHDDCPLRDLQEELREYITFVNIFVNIFECKDYLKSYKDKDNVVAFRYYRSGSERMDNALSYIFFKSKAEKNPYQQVNIGSLIALALQDFHYVMEQFTKSDFFVDAKLKASFIDLFYQLYVRNYFK